MIGKRIGQTLSWDRKIYGRRFRFIWDYEDGTMSRGWLMVYREGQRYWTVRFINGSWYTIERY